VFGRGELGEREVGEREIQEKMGISPVWHTSELRKREFLGMGPTCFRISPDVRRNRTESLFFQLCPCIVIPFFLEQCILILINQ